jgi:hypothetical protein
VLPEDRGLMFLVLFSSHVLLLHKVIGRVLTFLQGLSSSVIQVLLRESVRQILPIAIVVELIITSVDPNKPPAPNYYRTFRSVLGKRASRPTESG